MGRNVIISLKTPEKFTEAASRTRRDGDDEHMGRPQSGHEGERTVLPGRGPQGRASGHHAFPDRRRLAGGQKPQLRRGEGGVQKHLGQSRLLEARPGEIPPGIAPCRGAGPGTGRGDLPLVQPERTGRLCRLGEGRAGPRRSLRRVRHPHVQDRRTGNPRQTLRKQPAAAVRPRAGADGRPSVEENADSGHPVQRPLFMHYESDAKAYDIQYEYLFGRDMLIAPVYEQDKHEWDVYLPQDEWVHLWTGEEYHGGEITVSAELGYTPAFYRKNSEFADIFEEIREKYGVK